MAQVQSYQGATLITQPACSRRTVSGARTAVFAVSQGIKVTKRECVSVSPCDLGMGRQLAEAKGPWQCHLLRSGYALRRRTCRKRLYGGGCVSVLPC